jgi:cytochrome P450
LTAVDREGDGGGMTERQARDEAMTMLLAGHDTTAATLAWAWHEIARHPHVQQRLHQEVDEVLAQRPATHDDLPRLTYTQMVIKETLRLYPATFVLFAREALEPVELGGYSIPRGAWVYASPWITQRHESVYPDPLTFDPQRFAPDAASTRPQFAWFPFGGGPHACIGSTFAQTEMTLIVASVLQRFRVQLAPGQGEPRPEVLLSVRPAGGLRVIPQLRTFPAAVCT